MTSAKSWDSHVDMVFREQKKTSLNSKDKHKRKPEHLLYYTSTVWPLLMSVECWPSSLLELYMVAFFHKDAEWE